MKASANSLKRRKGSKVKYFMSLKGTSINQLRCVLMALSIISAAFSDYSMKFDCDSPYADPDSSTLGIEL